MAFTYGFYNSLNSDRVYNAEQISAIFDGLITDGVYDTIGQLFAVRPSSGMQITVGTGRAWFNHTWNNNDALLPLFIDQADMILTRYDTVVLEVDASLTNRKNSIKIIKGVAGTHPIKPILIDSDDIHQHALAHIRVDGGATEITEAMIQVVVGTSECPFVTGIIETASIDALFQKWNGEFYEWWENIKATLDDNVVTHLQNQIDALKTADGIKITDETAKLLEMENGSSVDEALAVIQKDFSPSVGDIKSTVASSIGKNWFLCNGDPIEKIKYKNSALIIDPNFNIFFKKECFSSYRSGICAADDETIVIYRSISSGVITIASIDRSTLTYKTETITLPDSNLISMGFIHYQKRLGLWVIGAGTSSGFSIYSSTKYNEGYTLLSSFSYTLSRYYKLSNGELVVIISYQSGTYCFFNSSGSFVNVQNQIGLSSNIEYYNGKYYGINGSESSNCQLYSFDSLETINTKTLVRTFNYSNSAERIFLRLFVSNDKLYIKNSSGSSITSFFSYNGSSFSSITFPLINNAKNFYKPVFFECLDSSNITKYYMIGQMTDSSNNPYMVLYDVSTGKMLSYQSVSFSVSNTWTVGDGTVFSVNNGEKDILNYNSCFYYFGPCLPIINIDYANIFVYLKG